MNDQTEFYAAILYRTEHNKLGPMRFIAHVLDGAYTTRAAAEDAAKAALPDHPEADDFGAQTT